jgi:DNA polymerase (family 10)
MTARLVRSMKLPHRKVWGHALGRLLLRRPPLACRVEEVLDAIAEAGGVVEINGDPRRLDLEPRWVRAARERGIRFVISSDAHSVRGIEVFSWGVDMARRGWVTRDEVLNAQDVDAFAAAVKP